MIDASVKKRLMYLSGEDYYLYCYSIIVILDSLGCRSGKIFRDYRKLAFLIEIITDKKTTQVISSWSNQGSVHPKDRERLLDSYSNGLIRRSEILKLLFVLENRGFVALEKGAGQEIDVTLTHEGLPDDFLQSSVFLNEYSNLEKITNSLRRLASLTLNTMLSKIYEEKGIRTWGS